MQLKRLDWGQLSKALYDKHMCIHTHTPFLTVLQLALQEITLILRSNELACREWHTLTQDVLNLISNPPSCRKWQYPRMTWTILIIIIYCPWQQLIYKRRHCQKLHLEMKWGLFKLLMIFCLLLLTPSQRVTGDHPYCCTECSLICLIIHGTFHSKVWGDEVQDDDHPQHRGW